jgi:hypothetical protein
MSVGPLLAQAARRGAGGGGGDEAFAGMLGVIIVVGLAVLAVGLVIAIFFFLTQSKALKLCHRDNRTMEPGQVWLSLIPVFGYIWQFVVINRIAESLRNEFRDRGYRRQDDYGTSLGIAYLVLQLAGIIPFVGPLLSIAGLVCFIMYWVKLAGYNKELESDDDRPRRRSRRVEEEDEYEDDDRPRRAKKTRPVDEDEYEDDDRPKRKPWEK